MKREGGGPNEIIELDIASVAGNGAGLARTEQGVVFVLGALPGERVAAQITRHYRDFATARILHIEKEALGRTTPLCPAYSRCGACQLQHAEYPLQLTLKAQTVKDAMTRIGGFPAEFFGELRCEASPKQWGYRNKASFPVRSMGGKTAAGFYRAGSHILEVIGECPVNASLLNGLWKNVSPGLSKLPLPGYNEKTHKGRIRHIVIRAGVHTGETLLSFVVNGRLSAREEQALVRLGKRGNPSTLTVNFNSRPGNVILGSVTRPLLGSGLISERLSGRLLSFDTTSFFQINTEQAERLFSYVSSLADGGNILELYSGVGSLTCRLAERGRVTAVEEWSSAVRTAELNMKAADLSPLLLCGKAEDIIGSLDGAYSSVVADPPRSGCHRAVLEAVAGLKIPKVIYVSCNPATLARDCRILAEYGYKLISVKAFDMFPQTVHVETVVLMSRVER